MMSSMSDVYLKVANEWQTFKFMTRISPHDDSSPKSSSYM